MCGTLLRCPATIFKLHTLILHVLGSSFLPKLMRDTHMSLELFFLAGKWMYATHVWRSPAGLQQSTHVGDDVLGLSSSKRSGNESMSLQVFFSSKKWITTTHVWRSPAPVYNKICMLAMMFSDFLLPNILDPH
jgi:hypothetical protein